MYRTLLIVTVGVVLIVGRFVSSDDQTSILDRPTSLAPEHVATPIDEQQLQTISDIRASHAPDFLRDEDSTRVFRAALQDEARKVRVEPEVMDYEQDADTDSRSFPQHGSPASPIAADKDIELVESLLKSATLLNWRANLLEKEDHLAADKCRNLSERLRLEARSIRPGSN